ncbi:MAG: hypothetical protein GX539_05160, partial [Candidatus Cloacimonetes bacterium]|nr:hypothetical protein [Candidatus Cloacimonadota bacterium]
LAPGRLTSSPWPDRIEVSAAEEEGGVCVVRGTIVYATSTDTAGGEALHERVTLRLENDDGWRISGFAREEGGSDAAAVRDRGASGADAISSSVDGDAAPSPQEAAEVIRQYYAAIAAGDFARAYRLWSNNGGASGQTLQEFARGFAGTASVEADIGAPGDVEGAAGSVYVKVPVVVRAVTTDGERQRFEGTYTLRRSNVDGATEEQRAWRIYDADISPAADSAAPDA